MFAFLAGHRATAGCAMLAGFFAWVAFLHRSLPPEAQEDAQESWMAARPAGAMKPAEPFVLADPGVIPSVGAAPGVAKQTLLGKGRVPDLLEIVELELQLGGEEVAHLYEEEVAIYFGLEDGCELHIGEDFQGSEYSLGRGDVVMVFPGALHSAAHSGSRSRPRCKLLRLVHRSGVFPWPEEEPCRAVQLKSLKPVAPPQDSDLVT